MVDSGKKIMYEKNVALIKAFKVHEATQWFQDSEVHVKELAALLKNFTFWEGVLLKV